MESPKKISVKLFHVVNFLEQINELQDKINNGVFMKKDTIKSKGKKHYSIANFNTKFNKLTEFTHNNETVKTRFGGDFSR